MAEELGKFIFQESQEGLSDDIIQAKKKIVEVVSNYNKPYSKRYSPTYLQYYADQNSLYQKWHMGHFGDQSVTTLLPVELMWNFAYIFKPLLRSGVRVKQDLASLPEEEIALIRGVGRIKTEFILAMRDLAIAERGS